MLCLHLSFSVSQLLAFGAANLVFTLSYASLSIKILSGVNYKKPVDGLWGQGEAAGPAGKDENQ